MKRLVDAKKNANNTSANALKYSRCFLKAMAKTAHSVPEIKALLPLDRCRRFGGDVVHHAVDPFDLVDDVVADLGEEVVREMEPVGGHGIGGDNGAESHRILVGAFITHHSHTLDRQQDNSGLPDGVIKVRGLHTRIGSGRKVKGGAIIFTKPFYEYVVGLAENVQFLFGDVAYDTDGE